MSNIAIAGLGWLGIPLAVNLINAGHTIKGSTTSEDKLIRFKNNGIKAHHILFTEDGIEGDIYDFLKAADIAIILIPPGLRRNSGHNHALKMVHFLNAIEASDVKKVILVSSTGVYDDEQGKVTENDLPQPSENRGKQLLEVEKMFQDSQQIKTTVIRFGGLFGGSRNPVKYLAGRTDLNNGQAPVNLIHRDDCIRMIKQIIDKDAFGYIFNGVSPEHPTKADYYAKKANELGLEPPHYTDENETAFKQIDSVNLKEVLDFKFQVSL